MHKSKARREALRLEQEERAQRKTAAVRPSSKGVSARSPAPDG